MLDYFYPVSLTHKVLRYILNELKSNLNGITRLD